MFTPVVKRVISYIRVRRVDFCVFFQLEMMESYCLQANKTTGPK